VLLQCNVFKVTRLTNVASDTSKARIASAQSIAAFPVPRARLWTSRVCLFGGSDTNANQRPQQYSKWSDPGLSTQSFVARAAFVHLLECHRWKVSKVSKNFLRFAMYTAPRSSGCRIQLQYRISREILRSLLSFRRFDPLTFERKVDKAEVFSGFYAELQSPTRDAVSCDKADIVRIVRIVHFAQ
jgi:hypothetical protein